MENNGPITDTEAYFNMYNKVGTGVGKIFKSIIGFNPALSPSR